ncbi:bisanhydrobacterioruberin hydratase [Natrinema limicola]|uniref:Carotene biosynthesis associated membrane protein n=1 Tax=Natrinema limicola JCM 13563 TaxID=1230457 RepID=M0C6U5_9EURY|nr:bisanhydrobacterioruberin hydratase [Natrinema limicola]ELZ17649.1 carotene biosynthesis associated membrane protein [Natrinema limicola JCM 13563]
MDSGESKTSASSTGTDTNTNRTPSVHDSTADESTRAVVQRRLEALIRENRFTIAVVFPVIGAVTLVASAEGLLPPLLSYNPLLILFGTLVMRSPLVVALLPELDRRALVPLVVLTAYTYAIELVGIQTGWPYGTFEYGIRLGPMLGGDVPLALPLFFVPLVLNAYLLTLLALGARAGRLIPRAFSAITAVLAIDLVLDPAAVAIGFWSYVPPGGYYGVPASNYWGWLLSGAIAVVLVDLAFDRAAVRERVRTCEFALDDLVSFVLLWGTINALYGQWLAAGVAGLFCLVLLRTERYDLSIPSAVRSGDRN